MSNYELVFIISPEVTDEEVPNTVEKVKEFVSRIGGSITEVNQWGRRKMAYSIKRFTEGIYILAKLEMEPSSAKDLEANLWRSDDILRHLLIRL